MPDRSFDRRPPGGGTAGRGFDTPGGRRGGGEASGRGEMLGRDRGEMLGRDRGEMSGRDRGEPDGRPPQPGAFQGGGPQGIGGGPGGGFPGRRR